MLSSLFRAGDGASETNPALSCRFLFDKFQQTQPAQDIYYMSANLTGPVFRTVCDMSTGGNVPDRAWSNAAGGGWTLLVTSANYGWTLANTYYRNASGPSTSVNHVSITEMSHSWSAGHKLLSR